MSKRYPHLDPSDHSAGTPSGTNIFEIVSIEDPEKSGRVQIRPIGSMEQFPDPNQMQWVPIEGMFAPNKGWGFSGVPYEVGARVRCEPNGQQGWSVVSAIPNTLTDDKSDQHPETRDQKAYPHVRQPGGKGQQGDKAQGQNLVGSDRDHRNRDGQLMADLNYARRLPFNLTINGFENYKERAKNAPTSKQFLERSQPRNGEDKKRHMGSQYFGKQDMEKLDKAMQQAGVPFQVPQTPTVLDELRNTAKSGELRKAENSVGGDGIIQAAISFASSFRSNMQKQNQQNQQNNMKEWLYMMYRQENPGKEPLDANGNETAHYKQWEVAFLKRYNEGQLGATS